MRIATYNIWNTDKAVSERKSAILTEIKKVNADIVCLQEVMNYNYYKYIHRNAITSFPAFSIIQTRKRGWQY